ncbi:relaxase/mobilization nuclease domain-containing protein [Muricauda sp. 334s03]|uniref:Relaxase/mobilization nuclease domain-containing protein n=1 Tax=Flagellimonas yonaguniensis TaxID=3031325 RepID=A0ABT5XZE5_9FLAO|nr:relaxase/mobilization nuclease domain-containing protein [[Muricauda] yonaguniensis]MDF0716561.1 relaxase/mobilization nuclease domain-containing protein [[Muricauda] yonaguniensis]
MIAKILFRETVHGVLNYVFGKEGSIILGYPNTCSEFGLSPEFFTNVLHFQGQRHATENRYVHITINLPHGERLDDTTFYQLGKDYMAEMGLGNQPFCVVLHEDTKHQHIHLVSTVVTESASLISMFNSYRRSMATQAYLEKRYGLLPSPQTRQKQHRELPIYRFPEFQFKPDDSNGTRFYIQDVMNGLLQKHKVRSFAELKQLARPYHIIVNTMTHESGRVGVAYGIDNQKKYKTQFINGSTVHPKLSGPKLVAIFEKNSKSKLLAMHKKRLEKQWMTTLKLFKSIRQEDLPDVLKSYQNIDCELSYGKNRQLNELIIYDKSGYVFLASEISSQMDFIHHPQLEDDVNGTTCLDENGKQFLLETRKLIKNAFYEAYLQANKSDRSLSEFVITKNLRDLLPHIAGSERYSFLNHYMSQDKGKNLLKVLKTEFEGTRRELHKTESRKEMKTLEDRVSLFKNVLEANVFDATKSLSFNLLQGLGLKYVGGKVFFSNSKAHSVELLIEDYKMPEVGSSYISTGSINQNVKVLETLTETGTSKPSDLNATSLFLPLLLPELYESMNPEYQKQFEALSLRAYLRMAEQFNLPLEKSPVDYIRLFNAKGFYFEKKVGKVYLRSLYSKNETNIPLSTKTQAYLKSSTDLDAVLAAQMETVNISNENGQMNLKNLWVSYLIERGVYGRAAYMMVYEGVRPNLHREALEYHKKNGLREKIHAESQQKINTQQAAILRKSVYSFSSLLSGKYKEEVFNGFRDELTDYTNKKGLFR